MVLSITASLSRISASRYHFRTEDFENKTRNSFFLSAESFYKAVHTTHRGVSSTATGGVSRCPFRAAVQSKQLHTSAVAAQLSPSPSPAVLEEEKKKQTASVSQKQEGGLPKEVQCSVKRATKDGQCECAAQGLQPIGEPYNLSNTAKHYDIFVVVCYSSCCV